MNKQLQQIAARIKDLREFSDYTLEDMAHKTGMSVADYSDIESATVDISINALYNIAKVLDIDPTVILTGENSSNAEVAVVYDNDGVKIERYSGYSFVSLAHKFIDRKMEPMIVTLKGDIEPELVKHNGQEFNYVLSGKLRVIVGGKEYYLRAGDSIYFNPQLPHAQISMAKESKFLTVIMEE